MFPTDVEYAQNGRFAVGIHTGGGTSGKGAVTVISDEAVDAALQNVVNPPPSVAGDRPFFSVMPLCEEYERQDGRLLPRCSQNVFKRLFNYTSNGVHDFERPRGVAIQPFVAVDAPRFGDHVNRLTAVWVSWRDPQITRLRYQLYDLGTAEAPTDPVSWNSDQWLLTVEDQDLRFAFRRFGSFFDPGDAPAPGHRYRLVVEAVAGFTTLSTTATEFTYKRPR
jgi:hypothetical protein